MNSGMFDSGNAFESEWDNTADTSEFLYDSPVSHSQDLFSLPDSARAPSHQQATGTASAKREHTDSKSHPHLKVPTDAASQPSSTTDSRSSSSQSPAQTKHAYSTSPPLPTFGAGIASTGDLPSQPTFGKLESIFGEEDNSFALDSGFPSVNSDMDHLTLGTSGFDFGTAPTPASMGGIFAGERDQDMTPRTLGAIKDSQSMNASPQMTVSPQKMFTLESREDSPNDMPMNSGQSSPFPLNNNSPMGGTVGGFGGDFPSDTIDGKMSSFSGGSNMHVQSGTADSDTVDIASLSGMTQPSFTQKWPCQLLIDPTPEKSRVETQIPIKLTLKNPPAGFNRLHLPGYTISKPKFQQKPPFEGDDETLELSTLLVCASAMQQKEGALERAFQRAEADEVPVHKEESPPGAQDENDLDRPLNGGPVAICSGCIVRERKRANRKKNKKVEEEEEWQKDEAKRVIVFNCQEIKDWCIDGSKEAPVKDHTGSVDGIYVNAPMRIACYCRHQSEKVGFQVIFTVRRPNGEILAQGISQSIMITDDHKQPPPSAMQTMAYNQPQQAPQGVYQPSGPFPMYQNNQGYHPSQDLPFRPSFSVPNLSQMGQQYPQHNPNGFARQFSSNNLAANASSNNLAQTNASASATPRTLSRPASPTNPEGQPGSKKRRSGGPGHAKVPSTLSMTRIDPKRSPPPSTGPLTGTSASASFSFHSPTSSSFATTPLDGTFPSSQHMRQTSLNQQSFQGQPAPHQQGAFGMNEPDMGPFYSAPTSQHQSRAPSPSSAHRYPHPAGFPQHVNPGQVPMQAMQNSVPSQAAAVLSNLPPGLNLNKPPIIQRLIPARGSRAGGEEVTVLGSGFFAGLEVMFGDTPARSVAYWGDTTVVCQAPTLGPNERAGPVNVVFQHQHPNTAGNVENIPALMPTRLVQYTYVDDTYGNGNQFGMYTAYGANNDITSGGSQMNTPHNLASSHGTGSPINGSPGMEDNGMGGGIPGMARGFFAQQQGMGQQTPPRQPPGSGSAGFNAAAQARRQPLSRTVSGDATTVFRRPA